ncbi:MAG: cytochrome d ubiquinol oxidase subunit II [Firmicutes bacterium]|nr:cytochrome d ubiquinol oxidase subunit II [Alicyclobacillaceae bacterium]MCL6498144.1 cytochrome d ubiquinol oxidase subunit II [Bacillota bacterium]
MLPTVWFVLIAVLFVGYFFLEGFDYGVGVWMPVLGRTDGERRAILATIGPVWDANEVWLITAAGALFAAFPAWYASLFSGFYPLLALILGALIVRGVGLEFRSKGDEGRWRRTWDAAIATASGFLAAAWGFLMGALLHGVPIDRAGDLVGGIGAVVTPYALEGALASLLLFSLHGALYLTLKAPPPLAERARRAAFRVGGAATAAYFLFVVMSYFYSDFARKLGVDPGAIPILAGLSMVAVRFALLRRTLLLAFFLNGVTIILSTVSVFLTLWPRVMISSLNPAWSLTVAGAAANPYSLSVMSITAVVILPVVLAYQAWTYWVFRQRVGAGDTFHY